MPRLLYYQDGATLRTPRFLYYQDGGSLRVITEGYYQDGGTLRQWWPAEFAFLAAQTATGNRVSPSIPPAIARLGVYADGTVKRTLNAGAATTLYTWLLSGVNTDYEVLYTYVSGTVPAGPIGVWSSLGSDQIVSLSLAAGSPGSDSAVVSVQIRQTAGGAVVAGPVNFTLNCTVS